MVALISPKNAVAISIIGNVLAPRPDRATCRAAQSKGFRALPKIGI